jgi:hypothetical protein
MNFAINRPCFLRAISMPDKYILTSYRPKMVLLKLYRDIVFRENQKMSKNTIFLINYETVYTNKWTIILIIRIVHN